MNPSDAIRQEKAGIRRAMKQSWAALGARDRSGDGAAGVLGTDASLEELAERLWTQIEASGDFRRARTVLLYASLPDEVPTAAILRRWSAEKRLVLPLVCTDGLRLKQYDPARLQTGYHGIPEPLPDCPEVAPEAIDFAIIPGVAFTREGGRLGRGKGYYDRLLPRLTRAVKVGAAFPFQMRERLPLDAWDVPLDIVYSFSVL